jgi:hypothetical protein
VPVPRPPRREGFKHNPGDHDATESHNRSDKEGHQAVALRRPRPPANRTLPTSASAHAGKPVRGSSEPGGTDLAAPSTDVDAPALCNGPGSDVVVLVEGGVVWVGPVPLPLPWPPPPDDGAVETGGELVVPWGVDVDGAVVVELDVGEVVVLEPVDDGVVELVVGVVVLVDVEPPDWSQWFSLVPPLLPCSSQSFPFVDGSVVQACVELPTSHGPWPGGAGGLSNGAATA